MGQLSENENSSRTDQRTQSNTTVTHDTLLKHGLSSWPPLFCQGCTQCLSSSPLHFACPSQIHQDRLQFPSATHETHPFTITKLMIQGSNPVIFHFNSESISQAIILELLCGIHRNINHSPFKCLLNACHLPSPMQQTVGNVKIKPGDRLSSKNGNREMMSKIFREGLQNLVMGFEESSELDLE